MLKKFFQNKWTYICTVAVQLLNAFVLLFASIADAVSKSSAHFLWVFNVISVVITLLFLGMMFGIHKSKE